MKKSNFSVKDRFVFVKADFDCTNEVITPNASGGKHNLICMTGTFETLRSDNTKLKPHSRPFTSASNLSTKWLSPSFDQG